MQKKICRKVHAVNNFSFRIPEDLLAELQKVRKTHYPKKSLAEVGRLMLWRGIKRTDVLREEKGR